MDKNPKKVTDAYYYVLAIRIAVDLGVTIAVPAVLAAILGKWLDERWGTEPFLLVLLLIVAFSLTAAAIYKKANYYAKLYNRE